MQPFFLPFTFLCGHSFPVHNASYLYSHLLNYKGIAPADLLIAGTQVPCHKLLNLHTLSCQCLKTSRKLVQDVFPDQLDLNHSSTLGIALRFETSQNFVQDVFPDHLIALSGNGITANDLSDGIVKIKKYDLYDDSYPRFLRRSLK